MSIPRCKVHEFPFPKTLISPSEESAHKFNYSKISAKLCSSYNNAFHYSDTTTTVFNKRSCK